MISLIIAGVVSLALSLLGTRYLITWLRYHRVGQPIHEDVEGHSKKAGTPTMGGVAVVVAAVVGYGVAHLHGGVVFTITGLLVMLCIATAAMVGALDDWIKVSYSRNLGLSKRAKAGGLLVVAVGFVVAMVQLTSVHTTLSFTRYDNPGLELGTAGWCLWGVLLILGFANAVNLTDGLDGLAAGSAMYGYMAFVVIAFWVFRNDELYMVEHALDLAVVAVAMVGGITGFLWWNAPPAHVFMGDTGSLAIGAGIAALGLALNVQLLVPLVGALFVFETLSVIVQVSSFRILGRRPLRMAPVHHHFELGGWPETTVLIRFWILALMSTAVALGIFYSAWLTATDEVDDVSGAIRAGGDPVTVDISTPGQDAVLTVDGTAGQRLRIHASEETFSSCSPVLQVMAPDGTVLADQTCVRGGRDDALEPVELPADGEYRVVVDPADGTTGSVTLSACDASAGSCAPTERG